MTERLRLDQILREVVAEFHSALTRDGVESGYDLEAGLIGPHVANMLRELAQFRFFTLTKE